MSTLADRMADFRPRQVGRVTLPPDLGWPPARQAPAPTPAPGPAPAPAAASARGDGLRRVLTPVEAAAGLDPQAIRAELESARDLLLDRWAPVIAAQRRDLAAQVEAAVDEGRIDRLATIAADPGDGTGLLYRAMSAAANKAAARMIGEAAAQGVTIDPKTVSIDEGRLRKIAAARATVAAQALGAAASRRALQVVQAAAGAEAAQQVTATLAGMSTASLADQLMAAMHAASNEGRFAVMDAGPEAAYTSSEVMDQNTCLGPDTEVTTARGPVRADEVRLNDHLLTHAGRWVQPSHIVVSEVEEPLVRVRLDGLSAPERVLVLTQDHPVLVAERGGLLWREAGQLTPGDLVVGEASAQPGRELRVPDLGFGQPPHRVAAGGQVRRLAAIHVQTQRMPVGPIGLDYQVVGQEIDHPRPDLRLAAEVVSGSAQRQPDGPLQAGLRAGGPVAAHGAEPLTGLGGRHDPKRCAALGAGDHDRRAAACLTAVPPGLGAGIPERRAAPGTYGVSSAGIAATPAGAVGVATGVGNGHLEVPAAAGAGLGDPVPGRPHPGADLGIGEFACDGAVDGPRFAPAGNLPAAGCAVAGRILDAEGGRPGAVAAHRPLDDDSPAPASTQAIHNLSLYVVGAVSRERHAGLVYDFTIPGDATFCAGGVIVHNCKPCLSIDGYRFASLADARAAYAAGGYKDCDGGLRCRGTVVASWEEPPPPGTPEAYEQGLYGPLGQHLGPSSWRDVGLAGSAGEDDPKAAGRWSPAEHPRDGRGRFARKADPDYLPPPRVIARTPPGQLDLWHHTTPRAARDIYRTGTWESQAQGRVYGSTVPFGVGGYGKAAVHIRVPAGMAKLENTLPTGERHYSVPAAGLTPEHLRDLYSGSDEEQWWAEWRRRAGYVSGASSTNPP